MASSTATRANMWETPFRRPEPPRMRRVWTLRGRDAELAVVGELIAAVATGTAGLVLFDGPAGSGRTRMLEATAAIACRNRFAVPLHANELAALADDHQPHTRHVRELQARVADAAATGPVLVVADDLHRADAETLRTLRVVSSRLREAPILWALAANGHEAAGEAADVLGRLEDDGALRLALDPLDAAATAALAEEVLGSVPTDALAEIIARAGGHPRLLVELLEGLVEDRVLEEDGDVVDLRSSGVPARLRRGVERRLEALGHDVADVLRIAAVLGRFSVDQIAAMLGTSPAALLAPVHRALRAGVLAESDGRLAFENALEREAVMAALPAELRRGLRRQAAEVLLASGADSSAVAEHLAAGARPGDHEAVRTLRDGARRLAATDLEEAADASLRAIDLLATDDPSWGPLVAETVILMQAALRDDEATTIVQLALDGSLPPEQEAEVRVALATPGSRPCTERIAHGRAGLELGGVPAAVRMRHLALLAMNLALAGEVAEAGAVLGVLRSGADAGDDDLTGAAASLAEACLHEAAGRPDEVLRVAAAAPRLPAGAAAKAAAGILQLRRARALADLGRLGEALEVAGAATARAEREHHRWLAATCAVVHADLLVQAGELAEAAGVAGAVARRVRAEIGSEPHTQATLVLGEVALLTADSHRLRLAVRHARDLERSGDAALRARATRLLALAAVADGDPDEAWRWAKRATSAHAGVLGPLHVPVLVRLALVAGREEHARRAAEDAAADSRAVPSSPVAAAAAVHARGLVTGAASDLERAAELLRRARRPLALADALEDLCRALAAAGRRSAAEEHAREATELLRSIGAKGRLRDLRHRLRPLGLGRRGVVRTIAKDGWASLTEAELNVIRLVVEGRTNRQVAERLVLSPHTVSTHLRHAFAKLGINSRVELARAMVDAELAEADAA